MRAVRGRALISAHPRSRGENHVWQPACDAAGGSSPLTRGKHKTLKSPVGGSGLIPAHAGKTPPGKPPRLRSAAHPRSRGENELWEWAWRQPQGSSPLTRGKRCGHSSRPLRGRLIPAHAGKTPTRVALASRARAHPRSRGENARGDVCGGLTQGSSPLTRGKPLTRLGDRRHMRLIPAHAGKTCFEALRARWRAAHPRSRGENADLVADGGHFKGSSPLTRGKPVPGADHVGDARLIPAHAGKTLAAMSAAASRRAHPRSRGENPLRGSVIADTCGSSPLTRGKPSDAPFNG